MRGRTLWARSMRGGGRRLWGRRLGLRCVGFGAACGQQEGGEQEAGAARARHRTEYPPRAANAKVAQDGTPARRNSRVSEFRATFVTDPASQDTTISVPPGTTRRDRPMPQLHALFQTAHKRSIDVSPTQRRVLEQFAAADTPDENVRLRARIILAWADGISGQVSAELLSTSRRTVTKWRARFTRGGVEALWDRPRPGAPRTISQQAVAELLRLRQSPPPYGKPRWTTRMLAEQTGLSQSTVVRLARGAQQPVDH
jgi:transposase